ncbi:MAG: hypothetical protein GY842_21775 [bacterium]|nr:hypothetical protein [bacterium]
MTCIVPVTDGQTVVIGGDSALTGGHELRLDGEPKVFRVGSYVMGFTTSLRMGQILRYGVKFPDPPEAPKDDELLHFMVTEFVEAVREAFAAKGFAKTARFAAPGDPSVTEEGQERGGVFVVGVAGQIFEIRQDYHVGRPATPYTAIGQGALIALGALHALAPFEDLSLRARATRALEASQEYCSAVRGPFHFVDLPPVTPCSAGRALSATPPAGNSGCRSSARSTSPSVRSPSRTAFR